MQDELTLPVSFITEDTGETEETGRALARLISEDSRQAFVAMYGDLGVGKTAFVRGFCSYFGDARVKSPTFSIVNEYRFESTSVFHFDMYRITDGDDLYSIGYDDYVEADGYCIAEWSENIENEIPSGAIFVTISRVDGNTEERRIDIDENSCI